MTTTINDAAVLRAIEYSVERRGYDFVYQNNYDCHDGDACKYVVDDGAACIVGYALIEALGLKWPENAPGNYINGSIVGVYNQVETLNDVEFTDEAIVVLAVAQAVQDCRGNWGLALIAARKASQALEYVNNR